MADDHGDPPPACRFFARGYCRNGERCAYRHERPAAEPAAAASPAPEPQPLVLSWPRWALLPLEAEEGLLRVLLHWPNERGMMRDQPEWRVRKLAHAVRRVGALSTLQATSLRRHHIRAAHPYVPSARLGLGADADIRAAATLFEEALGRHLAQAGVVYEDEPAQRRRGGAAQPGGTPDFLLRAPLRLRLGARGVGVGVGDAADAAATEGAEGAEEVRVHWLDAKHFYGASTIEDDGRSAVGKLCATGTRYNAHFGRGAFVFAHGCGAALCARLEALGVCVLDARPLDVSAVRAQQRTWCADARGNILP